MSPLPGFLTVRVLRGINLVSRDATGSDPYVVLHLDGQKVKTNVIKKTVNPVWDEDLTLAVRSAATPIKLEVFDKDTFSKDDKMGDAEFDIEALMQMIQMDLEDIHSGTVVRTVRPSKHCCLADESPIIWENGHLVQDVMLKLRNVETGVLHLQLKWVNIPGTVISVAEQVNFSPSIFTTVLDLSDDSFLVCFIPKSWAVESELDEHHYYTDTEYVCEVENVPTAGIPRR
ncbi:hypothetical protein EJB05_13743 [Eragrostis curvula]|uniref:C2 domain-containing protein n=1 Tax=Eragrostis curvula TaxID=38414 RepID=A0A5J9VXC1_9POAL|nr:hypothetical protein EJB05_13743 [Eragrostis curvula]